MAEAPPFGPRGLDSPKDMPMSDHEGMPEGWGWMWGMLKMYSRDSKYQAAWKNWLLNKM